MANGDTSVYSLLPGLGLPSLPPLPSFSNSTQSAQSPSWFQSLQQFINGAITGTNSPTVNARGFGDTVADATNQQAQMEGGSEFQAGQHISQNISSYVTIIVGLVMIAGGLFLFGTSQVAGAYISKGKALIA